MEIPGGGGEYYEAPWKGKSWGVGDQTWKNPPWGGMDIFWNHTMFCMAQTYRTLITEVNVCSVLSWYLQVIRTFVSRFLYNNSMFAFLTCNPSETNSNHEKSFSQKIFV